jgi:hypothetical protein
MNEYILNLHMHTLLSDGVGTYDDILRAALEAGVDAVLVTDHNVWMQGAERIFQTEKGRVFLLIGEEVHDQSRNPQKDHLLVFNARRELATFAFDPQKLIDEVNNNGGMSFLAHPMETDMPFFGEPDISWVDWQAVEYTGIELWNGLSEFKAVARTKAQAIFYAFFPERIPHGPPEALLKKWDELLISGKRVLAIGGSDAHDLIIHLGPFHREIFPYGFHFRVVNTHLLMEDELGDDLEASHSMIYAALKAGHCFVGNDLPHPTRGFRFTATSGESRAIMGDELVFRDEANFMITLPIKCDCRLLRNGEVIGRWQDQAMISHKGTTTGIYRVECRIRYKGKSRGWIFSNPIFVRR